jgi:hypothetical protein
MLGEAGKSAVFTVTIVRNMMQLNTDVRFLARMFAILKLEQALQFII